MSRSVRTKLLDVAGLIAEIGLRKAELVGISVYDWGDPHIHIKPEEFVRLGNLLGVKRADVTGDAHGNNFHAHFTKRRALFTAVFKGQSPDVDAALSSLDKPNLTRKKPLGLPAPKVLIGELVD